MTRYLIVILAVISLSGLVSAQDSGIKTPLSPPLEKKDTKSKKWSTADINGVQWLIDPEGKPFYSKGVDIVSPGKESEKSRAAQAYCWANFYPSIEQWRTQVGSRLREWGFNTLGGWSDSSPDI